MATAKLDNFVPTGDEIVDLNTLSNLPVLNSYRDVVGADMVAIMLRNPAVNFVDVCGASNVQTYPGCQSNSTSTCGVGSDFEDFAYFWVSQDCAVSDNSFTHELGHAMGGNHVRFQTNPPQFPTGWDSDVILNGYEYAFGNITLPNFASIMSIASTPERRLYFSNPDVTVDGVVTGSPGKDNARIIDELSPVMTTFRTRPDLIFASGFE